MIVLSNDVLGQVLSAAYCEVGPKLGPFPDRLACGLAATTQAGEYLETLDHEHTALAH
jgi:hypothetical protein